MRLIDADAAIDAIKEYIVDPNWAISEYEDNVFNYNAGLKSAVQAIVDLPPAQPEIILCKDCKYYIKSESYCDYLGITIFDLDFCSLAERRTDGSD